MQGLVDALYLITSQINRPQVVPQDKRELVPGNSLYNKRFIKYFDAYTAMGVVDMSICLDILISSGFGCWERIIRSVKRTLAAISGGMTMINETITTFFIKVERILNGRSISKVAADSRDVEAFSPNALLKEYLEAFLPMGVFTKADSNRKSWRLVGLLSDQI